MYQVAADFVLLLHLVFILFVIFGGLLCYKWRWLIWIHIPAAIWGAMIVIVGWICPLTPLENWLRHTDGQQAYSGSFIEHYIVPVIYPASLSKAMFVSMGVFVIIVNLIVYTFLYYKLRNRDDSDAATKKTGLD